jgi:isocitrate dehydrogenase kinase/phosphatase
VEALEQFRRGVQDTPPYKGKEFFREFLTTTRFKAHFTEETANLFYETVRCGILHQAETKEDSLFMRKRMTFVVRRSRSGKGLDINARRFHEELESAVNEYAFALCGDQPGMRNNFIKKMSYIARSQSNTGSIV